MLLGIDAEPNGLVPGVACGSHSSLIEAMPAFRAPRASLWRSEGCLVVLRHRDLPTRPAAAGNARSTLSVTCISRSANVTEWRQLEDEANPDGPSCRTRVTPEAF